MKNRREFIKTLSTGALVVPGIMSCITDNEEITHIVSISFDDGFQKSFLKTADIYEKYGLSACFNVIASGHLDDFTPPDEYILPEITGGFELWNDLKDRGHEVMPHGFRHADLAKLPIENAKSLVNECLAYFSDHLKDFDSSRSVFNFPFNSSSEELESWLNDKVMAYRTSGGAINPLPHRQMKKLTCISYGPENIDDYFEEQLRIFLAEPHGWFIFNAHGLDGEGWGPMSSAYLDELLDRLSGLKHVKVSPVGQALLDTLGI